MSKWSQAPEGHVPGITCRKCGVVRTTANTHIRRVRGEERLQSYCKACQAVHRDAYRRANLNRALCYGARHRAILEGLPCDIEPDDIVVPDTCPVFGLPIRSGTGRGKVSDNSPSVDKIIPGLGYVRGNIQVISLKANRLKSDMNYADVMKLASYMRSHGLHESAQS